MHNSFANQYNPLNEFYYKFVLLAGEVQWL